MVYWPLDEGTNLIPFLLKTYSWKTTDLAASLPSGVAVLLPTEGPAMLHFHTQDSTGFSGLSGTHNQLITITIIIIIQGGGGRLKINTYMRIN